MVDVAGIGWADKRLINVAGARRASVLKTAALLINEYGDLDTLLERA